MALAFLTGKKPSGDRVPLGLAGLLRSQPVVPLHLVVVLHHGLLDERDQLRVQIEPIDGHRDQKERRHQQ